MSDFDLNDARDFIAAAEKFDAQFGGLIRGAKMLKEMVSLEHAAREVQARLDGLKQKEVLENANIMARQEAAAKEIVAKHAEADFAIQEKHRKADDLIAEAEEKAARTIAAASTEAAGFANQAEEHRGEIARLKLEIEALKAEADKHDAAADESLKAAAAAKQRHEDEKAALRAFRANFTAAIS